MELKISGDGEITTIGMSGGGYFATKSNGKARVEIGLTAAEYGGQSAILGAQVIDRGEGKNVFMTVAADGSIRYWRMDADTGVKREAGVLPEGSDTPAHGYTFAEDGLSRLQSGEKVTEIALFRTGQEAPVHTLRLTGKIVTWNISNDGKFAALTSESGEIGVWRIGQEEPAAMFRVPRLEMIGHLDFSPKEGQLITASQAGKLRLWEIGQEEPLRVYNGHSIYSVLTSAFSDDGAEFLTSAGDDTMRLWRTDSSAPVHVFRTKGVARGMTFDKTGGRILAELDGSGDLALYDRRSESPVQVFPGIGFARKREFKDEKTIIVEEFRDRWTATIDPIVFESAVKQKQLACERLWEIGMREFTADDYQRFPFLDRDARHPCEKIWTEKDAAAP
jgi:WD40 repeat protein